jgi:transcriptional regulator of nitric oxide reductase
MGLGREIDNGVKLVLGHELIHLVGIGNVSLEEFVAIAMRLDQTVEVGKVAGVGQDINIGDVSRLVMFQNVANKVAANETAAARH